MSTSIDQKDYSIEKNADTKVSSVLEPSIDLIAKININTNEIKCTKGDCCRDCSKNNWTG